MSIEVKHFLPYSPATIWAIVGSPYKLVCRGRPPTTPK